MNPSFNDCKGYLLFVLHAHLPFVRHPEKRYAQEENWLFEAITETYIPLLSQCLVLHNDHIRSMITISLSPTLCTMLADPLLKTRYVLHLEKLQRLADTEIKRTKDSKPEHSTAVMYAQRFEDSKKFYCSFCNKDLISVFGYLRDMKAIELICCNATHAFLPLFQYQQSTIKAQIQVAVQTFKKFFGSAPPGMWLAECGYFPGIEAVLESQGITYFFCDTHAILLGKPKPKYGVYAPCVCPHTNVHAFGRDIASSKAVWSSILGYPGDPVYRDFYRDIGYDLPLDYIKPYIDPNGQRLPTGLKYYKITGKDEEKKLYCIQDAKNRILRHSSHFFQQRLQQWSSLNTLMDRPGLIVAPYDAELFGHWWHEGPSWLSQVLQLCSQRTDYALISASEYLSLYPQNQPAQPAFSSWGEHGYSHVWLNPKNDWIYRHLDEMLHCLQSLKHGYDQQNTEKSRILKQMNRELLLAQASDWPFLLTTGTMTEYAEQRIISHITNFFHLLKMLQVSSVDFDLLQELEGQNNIFPDLETDIFW